MHRPMPNLWTLGGLSLPELLRRTIRECWQDDVFGQGGRMAFYHFLAIFPSLLIFLLIAARVPHLAQYVKSTLQDLSHQVLPKQVSQLFQQIITQFSHRRPSGLQLLSVFAGAVWATHNGTWAMIYGLNKAYEVEERRSSWKLTIAIVGLTLSLAITAAMAIFLIFLSAYLQAHLHSGAFAHHILSLRILEWLILIAFLSFSFALLYRFAPNLRDHEWRWSTPGALCALLLWIASTFAARAYFDHINNYARSYGQLNSVAMFLLWLYFTNGAILIGGEMNSEIEKAAARRHLAPDRANTSASNG